MKTFHTERPNIFYYVTSVTYNRFPVLGNENVCQTLVSVFDEVRTKFPFKLIAYAIMPDHFHAIVNPIDGDISKWLLRVRGNAARRIIDWIKAERDLHSLKKITLGSAQKRNHKFALWQKDPSIVDLHSHTFVIQKTGYIHANPVRAGLIDHPAKWKWSSYHAYLPHRQQDIPIEMDQRPYWTDEELRAFNVGQLRSTFQDDNGPSGGSPTLNG